MINNTTTKKLMKTAAIVSIAAATAAAPLSAKEKLSNMEDGNWVTISGTVEEVGDDYLNLNYGDKTVRVDMSDRDWFEDSKSLLKGEQISIVGKVDENLFSKNSIEAESVYVKGMNSYFFTAKSANTTPMAVVFQFEEVEQNPVNLTGTVESIDGEEFVLDTGVITMTVDTDELGYDPFDDEGFQKVTVGDRVQVAGELDFGVLEDTEVKVKRLTTLIEQ